MKLKWPEIIPSPMEALPIRLQLRMHFSPHTRESVGDAIVREQLTTRRIKRFLRHTVPPRDIPLSSSFVVPAKRLATRNPDLSCRQCQKLTRQLRRLDKDPLMWSDSPLTSEPTETEVLEPPPSEPLTLAPWEQYYWEYPPLFPQLPEEPPVLSRRQKRIVQPRFRRMGITDTQLKNMLQKPFSSVKTPGKTSAPKVKKTKTKRTQLRTLCLGPLPTATAVRLIPLVRVPVPTVIQPVTLTPLLALPQSIFAPSPITASPPVFAPPEPIFAPSPPPADESTLN